MELESKYRRIAKEIVGQWGYEEEYWWRPIELALLQAFFDGQKSIMDSKLLETVKPISFCNQKCAENYKEELKK